jgi:hypothetical protein
MLLLSPRAVKADPPAGRGKEPTNIAARIRAGCIKAAVKWKRSRE